MAEHEVDRGGESPGVPIEDGESEVDDGCSHRAPSSVHSPPKVVAPDEDEVGEGDARILPPPPLIAGRLPKVEEGKDGAIGWRLKCPFHAACNKYRSLRQWQVELGPRSIELYLATWTLNPDNLAKREHKVWRPSLQEVRHHMGIPA